MGVDHSGVCRGLCKSVISRVVSGVTPFRVLITLLKTHFLNPLGLQARVQTTAAIRYLGFG